MATPIHVSLQSLPHNLPGNILKPSAREGTITGFRPGRFVFNNFPVSEISRKSLGAASNLVDEVRVRAWPAAANCTLKRRCISVNQSADITWSVGSSDLWGSVPWKRRGGLQSRMKGRPWLLSNEGHMCAAAGQGSTGKPVPEEEDPEAIPEQAPSRNGTDLPSEAAEVGDSLLDSDWRAFRARLVLSEVTGSGAISTEDGGTPARKSWAHPILAPEAGCVLIATEKLDGQPEFERTVILLINPGSSTPREGPYGLILNRPHSRRIKDMKPKDRTLVKLFGNCQVHLGGPLDTEVFLLLHGTSGIKGYHEVIPGVYYGIANGLEPTPELARGGKGSLPQDFRLFFGYSGWGTEQLKKELASGLWCVAACSTDLITKAVASGLWEEVLQLMGGKYAELSKRPRRKHF